MAFAPYWYSSGRHNLLINRKVTWLRTLLSRRGAPHVGAECASNLPSVTELRGPLQTGGYRPDVRFWPFLWRPLFRFLPSLCRPLLLGVRLCAEGRRAPVLHVCVVRAHSNAQSEEKQNWHRTAPHHRSTTPLLLLVFFAKPVFFQRTLLQLDGSKQHIYHAYLKQKRLRGERAVWGRPFKCGGQN